MINFCNPVVHYELPVYICSSNGMGVRFPARVDFVIPNETLAFISVCLIVPERY
jgi:hypothetical protein